MLESTTPTLLTCPYCGETVEIVFEADLDGELIQDCEICCNPWQVFIDRRDETMRVDVRRLDD